MTLHDYIVGLDERLLVGRFHGFWVRMTFDLMGTMGPETDPDLERLSTALMGYAEAPDTPAGTVRDIRSAIVHLRGPGFWRDNSVLGRKYRCLNAIASSREENEADVYNWAYGITTALDLIGDGDGDAIIAAVRSGLEERGA